MKQFCRFRASALAILGLAGACLPAGCGGNSGTPNVLVRPTPELEESQKRAIEADRALEIERRNRAPATP